jgi:hypothetical protein
MTTKKYCSYQAGGFYSCRDDPIDVSVIEHATFSAEKQKNERDQFIYGCNICKMKNNKPPNFKINSISEVNNTIPSFECTPYALKKGQCVDFLCPDINKSCISELDRKFPKSVSTTVPTYNTSYITNTSPTTLPTNIYNGSCSGCYTNTRGQKMCATECAGKVNNYLNCLEKNKDGRNSKIEDELYKLCSPYLNLGVGDTKDSIFGSWARV